MKLLTNCALAIGGLLFAPAQAEVKSATEYGFETVRVVIVKASAAQAYAMLGKPGLWWSGKHTYSGSAKNMSLQLHAGGCFCEAIPADKATVEHARVVFAQPGKTLRMLGGFGPLQQEGVSGALTFVLKPVDGGTEVTMRYVVGGYIRMGPQVIAPLVDQVLSEQLAGLKAALEN